MSKLMVWEECMVRIATAVEKYVEAYTPKQTQEPERKEPTSCIHQSVGICWMCKAEKEPECEHRFIIGGACEKCGYIREKPAKKYEGVSEGVKDELTDRLSKVIITRSTLWDAYADEARKWAVEVVEGCPALHSFVKNELISRLKDGRG